MRFLEEVPNGGVPVAEQPMMPVRSEEMGVLQFMAVVVAELVGPCRVQMLKKPGEMGGYQEPIPPVVELLVVRPMGQWEQRERQQRQEQMRVLVVEAVQVKILGPEALEVLVVQVVAVLAVVVVELL